MKTPFWLFALPLALLLGCSDDAATVSPDGGKLDAKVADAKVADAKVADAKVADAKVADAKLSDVGASKDQGTPDQGTPDQAKSPPILTSGHTGYHQKQCGNCHTLPRPNHTAMKVSECAACHGGNGACKPNGANSTKQNHKTTDNCVGCHTGGRHGFKVNSDCVNCHLTPTQGMVDCP